MLTALKAKKSLDLSKSHTFEERMCYHTHSSPNESIYCAVLWHKQYINSFGNNGDISFNLQNIHFSNLSWGLSNDLFWEIFKPEGVVFHKDLEYTKKAIWEIRAKYIVSFENADLLYETKGYTIAIFISRLNSFPISYWLSVWSFKWRDWMARSSFHGNNYLRKEK